MSYPAQVDITRKVCSQTCRHHLYGINACDGLENAKSNTTSGQRLHNISVRVLTEENLSSLQDSKARSKELNEDQTRHHEQSTNHGLLKAESLADIPASEETYHLPYVGSH